MQFGTFIRAIREKFRPKSPRLAEFVKILFEHAELSISGYSDDLIAQWVKPASRNTSYTRVIENSVGFNDSGFINCLKEGVGGNWNELQREFELLEVDGNFVDCNTTDADVFFESLSEQFKIILAIIPPPSIEINADECAIEDNDDNAGLFRGFVMDFMDTPSEKIERLIEGFRNGETDQFYRYIGKDSTYKYLGKLASPDYTIYRDTLRLLEDNLQAIIDMSLCDVKPLRIVTLGIGNGHKEIFCIHEVLKRTKSQLEFVVIDISPDMIKAGLGNIRQSILADPGTQNRLNIFVAEGDFMNIDKYFTDRYLPRKSKKRNLFLLLGNTLGSFEEDKLLRNIKKVMNFGDLILIDNQLKKPGKLTLKEEQELSSRYNSGMEKANVYAVLRKGAIFPEHGEIIQNIKYSLSSPYLNDEDCVAILQQFRFDKDVTISVRDKKIMYERGHIITVSYSRKYTHEALRRILVEVIGLEIVGDYSNDEFAMILCKKS